MVEALIRFALRGPLVVVVLCGVLLVWGQKSFVENPKDAIPDIADNQSIVFTEWMGRSPKDVDEQVTYPLTVAMQGVPGVREIRATSGFGWSIVYVIFNDDVDFYWARSRVLERLNVAQNELPDGVTPSLGPDATALGQIFWYTVENGWYSPSRPGLRFDESGVLTTSSRSRLLAGASASERGDLERRLDEATPKVCPLTGDGLVFSQVPLDRLRSIQDFDVKLALQSVEGISEVASVGGYKRQYQIDINPDAMRAYGVGLGALVRAVKESNVDVGAKVIEQNGMEVLVRGVGFLGGGERSAGTRAERERATIGDIENIVVKAVDDTPIYVRQLATVTTGPAFRRGALDKMGAEAVGGCAIMRFGENPLSVIERIKERLPGIEAGLPSGVRINAFYDRSGLIGETMATLGTALWEELAITVVVVVLFLLHLRSSLVIAVTLPLAVLFAFICMQALGIGSNIMSLAGIAIAIGTMVDMGIVMTENIYQYLTDRRGEYVRIERDALGVEREVVDPDRRAALIQKAASEVGPAILTAVATTVVSFLPVFFLEGQAAKLFTPLAWTKTFCLVGAVLVALVVVPPFASIMLRDRRPSRRISAALAGLAGLVIAIAWQAAGAGGSSVGEAIGAIRHYLGLAAPLDSILLGLMAAVVTWVMLRERIRPIESNALSRLICRVYEPLLRWILRHKATFLSVPVFFVCWGLKIWLGWGGVLWLPVWCAEQVGLAPRAWTAAGCFHLVLGALLGLVVLPLVWDTVRRRSRGVATATGGGGAGGNGGNGDSAGSNGGIAGGGVRWTRLGGRAAWLAVGLLLAAGLNRTGIVDRQARAVAGAFVLPFDLLGEVESRSLTDVYPIDELMSDVGIGEEFMPPLDEGDFLYMPSVLPAGSINTVMDVMRKQDMQLGQIPEVEVVVGKLGRIESALDPAPVGMLETIINLKPRDEWPVIEDPDNPGRHRRRTMKEIWADIQQAARFPGVLPSVELQPIRTRVEMLSTGLNAKIGLKIYGDSLERCEEAAVSIEALLRKRLDNAEAINAIRVNGKPYLEFHIDRAAIARYGVNIRDVQNVIEVAIGGMNLTTTYEGLDRYPVRIRYQRELRDDLPDLERILIPTPTGAQIPIAQVADIVSVVGPMSVRREGAKFVSYVTMSNVGIDETTLVRRGQALIDDAMIDGTLRLPESISMKWSGSYERNLRAKKRLSVLIPLVLLINFVLIYMQFRRFPLTVVVFLAIPVAFAGGFILLDYWPSIQNALYLSGVMERGFDGDTMFLTVAVWIGFIALFGIAVDDGIVIGTYLGQAFGSTPITRYEQIEERVVQAGLRRIRPCLMTTATTLAALCPVMLSTGRGSDVMVPMAIPVFGGMALALITLFVVPTCYCGIKQLKWRLGMSDQDFQRAAV